MESSCVRSQILGTARVRHSHRFLRRLLSSFLKKLCVMFESESGQKRLAWCKSRSKGSAHCRVREIATTLRRASCPRCKVRLSDTEDPSSVVSGLFPPRRNPHRPSFSFY